MAGVCDYENASDISDQSVESSESVSDLEEWDEFDMVGQLLIRGINPYQEEPSVSDMEAQLGRPYRGSTGRRETVETSTDTLSARQGNIDW